MSASRVALAAGANAFQRAYTSPETLHREQAYDRRKSRYAMFWHYYQNTAFDDITLWWNYVAQHRLYKHTRNLYNPSNRLVEFYAGIIYPGVLSLDADKLPDEVPSAIPLDPETPEELSVAIGQIWRWSQWQTNKALMVRYGAALGDVMVEVIDDLEHEVVQLDVVWPGFIPMVELDNLGRIEQYHKEYEYWDEDDQRVYTYRKEVTRDSFATFRDDHPFAFAGNDAVWDNPYGFVPAVWVNHRHLGGSHGAPCMRNINKFDSVNSLASSAVDQVLKVLAAPILIAGSNITKPNFGGQAPTNGVVQMPGSATNVDARESLNILTGDENSSVHSLNLPSGEAVRHMEMMIAEIEKDHPELGMYIQLREQMYVSASGADRMFGDVASLVYDARSSYDSATIEMLQMAVAIAGLRANDGSWKNQDTSEGKFDSFSIEDYHQKNLEFEILPRQLVPPAPLEAIKLEQAKVELQKMEKELSQMDEKMQIEREAAMQPVAPTGGPGGSVSSTNPSPQSANGQFG